MTVTPTYLTENLAELWLICPGFDDLLLTSDTTDADGHLFRIKAMATDSTWGKPVPIDVAVQRWMTDGAVASTQGYENREISFKVVVEAETAAELAAGETSLALRSGRPVLLKWVPPTGAVDTVPTVFEVWTWNFEHGLDMSKELRLARGYTITVTAKPWARSSDLTTVSAVPTVTSPTVTSIDTCASTSGWVGLPTSVTTSGGALRVARSETVTGGGTGGITTTRSLLRTGSVTGLGALPYLILDMAVTGDASSTYVVKVDNVVLVEVAVIGTQHYYALPAGTTSFTYLGINATCTVTHTGTVTLIVADVSATDAIAGVGSHKQLLRSVDVGGGVATSGSIQIASPDGTTALGTVLAYTCPDIDNGYTPPIRGYHVSGNTLTADAAAVSGQREVITSGGTGVGTGIGWSVPASQLREASYVILGRFYTNTLGVTLTSIMHFGVGSYAPTTLTSTIKWPAGANWYWCTLGALTLPDRMLPDATAANITIDFSATGGSGSQYLDEIYLLDETHGDYTLLDSIAVPRVWLDAPDVDTVRNRPAIYMGTASDKTDAVRPDWAQILAQGDHDLDPSGAVLLTVTDGVNDGVATASFYQRWHTHAGA